VKLFPVISIIVAASPAFAGGWAEPVYPAEVMGDECRIRILPFVTIPCHEGPHFQNGPERPVEAPSRPPATTLPEKPDPVPERPSVGQDEAPKPEPEKPAPEQPKPEKPAPKPEKPHKPDPCACGNGWDRGQENKA
jgi:hypothetical protein